MGWQRDKDRGPRPTLGDMRRDTCWVWAICWRFGCLHTRPVALAPYIIRWGAGASSDLLRTKLRCTRCTSLGCTIQMPSLNAANEVASWPIGDVGRWRSARGSTGGPVS